MVADNQPQKQCTQLTSSVCYSETGSGAVQTEEETRCGPK